MKNKGYEYARAAKPTRKALEKAFAEIENGKFGLAFSSGVAATDAVIKLLSPGDEVIALTICMVALIVYFQKCLKNLDQIYLCRYAGCKQYQQMLSMQIQN